MSFDLATALRDGQDETARALRRADRRPISEALRRELVEWAAWLRINRGLSRNTAGNYVDDVAGFFEWAAARGIAENQITPEHVTAWQQQLFLERREAPRTRALKLTALRMFYAWREGYNPTERLRGPKVPRRVPRKYTTKQVRKIFAACNRETMIGRRDFALLLMVYTTGARRDELRAMNLSDLELNARGGYVRFHGKGAKERTVGFGCEMTAALRDWLLAREQLPLVDREAVWVRTHGPEKGQRLSTRSIYAVIVRALRRAGIRSDGGPMGLHRLRATFATDLYDAGRDLREIQILMGHNDIRTTEGYIAITERQLRARMPDDRVREVTGKRAAQVPLWARRPGVMARLEHHDDEEED